MLIPPRYLRKIFRVRPRGVLHVGAHLGEEHEAYKQEGFGRVLWVEAQRNLITELSERVTPYGDKVFHAAVWSSSGTLRTLSVADSTQGASLFAFPNDVAPVNEVVQEGVTTVALRDLIPTTEKFDFINLDIQGSELEALRGLGNRINSVRWIYSEVNRAELYEQIPLVGEVDQFLDQQGFFRVATVWTHGDWGDALYVRRTGLLHDTVLRFAGLAFAFLVQVGMREFTRVSRIRLRRLRHSLSRGAGLV